MRFVHVNHRYVPFAGGSEQYVQAVSEALAADGHHVSVVTSDAFDLEYFWRPSMRRMNLPSRECIAGVDVTRVPISFLPFNAVVFQGGRRLMGEASRLLSWQRPYEMAARRLPWLPSLERTIAERLPADAILATNIGLEGLAATALRLARRSGTPLVLAPFLHIGADDDPRIRRYSSMPHQRALLRTADALIVMTRVEAEFAASVGASEGKIVIAGAGFFPSQVTGGDAARFRQRHGIRGALVGALGALARDKGSFDLVRAVIALRDQGHEVELALAGPALVAFSRWFERLDAHHREGIHILGVIDADDKRDMLAALDVLALPSRTESFGIVFLEGWANGKPVIAADARAVRELVRDRENGVVVPFGDPYALGGAILELLRNRSLSDRLAAAGRDLAMAHYTWPTVLQRVKRAYAIAMGYPLP